MTVQQKIQTTAELVAQDVRAYVRDRFTPGSLDALNDLQKIVQQKVHAAILSMKGQYECWSCGKTVDVEKVRCGGCISSITDF